MGEIIALANHKGGVSKTTTTANIGAILATRGKKVLIVDLDAQANLTTTFLNDEQPETIYSTFKEEGEKEPCIKEIFPNLSIIPSGLEMAGIEIEIAGKMQREFILKDTLDRIKDSFDYIFLDCPPSLGLITINAMVAADEIFIPVTAEALPSKGLTMLLDIYYMIKKRLNPALKLSGIIITRYENNKLAQTVEATLRDTFKDIVFDTKIRKNVSLAEAPLYKKDIQRYAPSSNGAIDYNNLVDEILQREKAV